MSLLKKAKKKIGVVENKLRPGNYISEIIEVYDAPGYSIGAAYVVKYKLTDVSGSNEYTKEETYINDRDNVRTDKWMTYLEQNGIDAQTYADLVGIQEELELEYQVHNGNKYLNIGNRKFV